MTIKKKNSQLIQKDFDCMTNDINSNHWCLIKISFFKLIKIKLKS